MIEILLIEKTYEYFEILIFYEIVNFAKEIEFPNLIHKKGNIEKEESFFWKIFIFLDKSSDLLLKIATPLSWFIGVLGLLIYAVFFSRK